MIRTQRDEFENLSGSVWDVVVVGAGPAGAMAAGEITRHGASVLLIDKATFPRYKVCGCCLNGRALSVLDAVGYGGLVESLGAQALWQVELATGGQRARLRLPRGAAVSREVFDRTLVDAAVAAGARFIQKCAASLIECTPSHWTLRLRRGNAQVEAQGRVVLAADGLGRKLLSGVESFQSCATVSSYIGAGAVVDGVLEEYAPGTIYMAIGRQGYVGLVRVERGRLNMAAAFDPRALRGYDGLVGVATAILNQAGYPLPAGMAEANWRGTPTLTRHASRLSAHRFLVLGDAAGYVEPITGEGMAVALSAGQAVAPIVCGALNHFDVDTEQAWANCYATLSRAARWRCRMIAAGVRRPWLVQPVTWVLARLPGLASPVIRRVNTAMTIDKEVHP